MLFGKVYKRKLQLSMPNVLSGLIFFLFVSTAAATLSLLHVLSLNASWTATTEG
jgi:hypothetical protein